MKYNIMQKKFKAWSPTEKSWCGAFSVHMSGMTSDMIDAKIDKDSGLAISDAHWNENDLIVVSYIGKKDIDNKEIYEGFIVHCKYDNKPREVHWVEESSCFKLRHLEDSDYYDPLYPDETEMKIVGNIFEDILIKEKI